MLARDRRRSLGLSQQEVADRAEVSRKWVSEFELGKAGSDFSIVLRLLAVLDLRIQIQPADYRQTAGDPGSDIDLDELLDGYPDRGRAEATGDGDG